MLPSSEFPRISFGIIVLNGEPFIKYLLRQIYRHAYEIIVVEGGSSKAANYAPSGHSTDNTLSILEEFRKDEDYEHKLKVVTRNGFWNEKDEQSQAYASIASGDYLWQVDVDEFYKDQDIDRIRILLKNNPKIDAISFRQITFWGSIHYYVDGFKLRADNSSQYHRLFKWRKGYTYVSHRPPTVIDDQGNNLRDKRWMSASKIEKLGIYLYHYSLLFPNQVIEKSTYYSTLWNSQAVGYLQGSDRWALKCYMTLDHPFHVHNSYESISWLKRFHGKHPEQIEVLMKDIKNVAIDIEVRNTSDIERILSNRYYRYTSKILEIVANILRIPFINLIRKFIKNQTYQLNQRRQGNK